MWNGDSLCEIHLERRWNYLIEGTSKDETTKMKLEEIAKK